LTDLALKGIDGELVKLYSSTGRESIPPGGLARVDWYYRLVVTAYNLMRPGKLIPLPAPVG
jgi:hypothetical protein